MSSPTTQTVRRRKGIGAKPDAIARHSFPCVELSRNTGRRITAPANRFFLIEFATISFAYAAELTAVAEIVPTAIRCLTPDADPAAQEHAERTRGPDQSLGVAAPLLGVKSSATPAKKRPRGQ